MNSTPPIAARRAIAIAIIAVELPLSTARLPPISFGTAVSIIGVPPRSAVDGLVVGVIVIVIVPVTGSIV